MAKQTRQEQIVTALIVRGCKEVVSKGKYRKLTLPGGKPGFYFVGKNGALREGQNQATSISLTHRVHRLIG